MWIGNWRRIAGYDDTDVLGQTALSIVLTENFILPGDPGDFIGSLIGKRKRSIEKLRLFCCRLKFEADGQFHGRKALYIYRTCKNFIALRAIPNSSAA